MTLFAKLFAVAALVAAFNVQAADPSADGPRKIAVVEGKYLLMVASAPDFAKDGTDELNQPENWSAA